MTHLSQRSAPDSTIAWLQVRGSEIYLSVSLLLFLGMKVECRTVATDKFLSFVHDDDVQVVSDTISARRGNQPPQALFRIVRRDGSVKLVSLAPHDLEADDVSARFSFREYSMAPERLCRTADAPADHGSWSIVDASRDLAVSRSVRTCLGMAADEDLTVSAILRAVSPDHRERAAALLTGAEPPSALVPFEIARFDTGVLVRCELSFGHFLDPDRPALGRWGALTDVTERDRRDGKLDELEGLVSSGLDMLIDGVAILNERGDIERLNQAGRHLLGEIPTGASLWERHPGLEADQLRHEFREIGAGARRIEEERYVPALQHWLSYRLFRLGSQVIFVFRSMDDHYRVRAALDQLSERMRLASTLGGVALWEYDQQADRVWMVPSSRQLLGAGAMTYGELQARIPADDHAAVEEARRQALLDGLPFEVEFRLSTPGGDVKVLRSRGGRVPGPVDRSSRLLGVLIDATPRANGRGSAAGAAQRPRGIASAISGAQVRAARGALRWSVRELAEHSDVSVATINRFEAGSTAVTTRDSSVLALHKVLLSQGIEFFKDEQGRPAIAIGVPDPPLGNGARHEAAVQGHLAH